MSVLITHPNWECIEHLLCIISGKLKQSQFEPSIIMGLSRGGLIPAVIMSHHLSVPMIPVCYSSKDGAGDDKNHNNDLPTINCTNILIVDDIADSGLTIKEVAQHYITLGHTVQTACLYHKTSAVYAPSYAAVTIPADSPFIYFPWESNLIRPLTPVVISGDDPISSNTP